MGDRNSYGSDPRTIGRAGDTYDPEQRVDYEAKKGALEAAIAAQYERFGVPFRGMDHDNRLDVPQRSFADPAEYERQQYFYHPDHLGSTSYVTDADGNVAQHVEYVPFGEVLVDQRAADWNAPYLFNAKELDEETGLYYYGARYYDPRLSLWLSTDPLELYSSDISTYAYCLNNPVVRIDPDGRYTFENIEKDQTYKVIGVFQSQYAELDKNQNKRVLTKDYIAAKSAGLPVILVDNIPDFANAMKDLDAMHTYTDSYTLNSHGYPGGFYIGSDLVNSNTDLSALRDGLVATMVFIGACNTGAGKEGSNLLKSFSKTVDCTVIGSCHKISGGYKYDGSDGLSEKPSLLKYIFGINDGNDYKISGSGSTPAIIYNVSIHKTAGIKWDGGNKGYVSEIKDFFTNPMKYFIKLLRK